LTYDTLFIETLIPATSLENEINRPHIGNNAVPQHGANVAGNSNPGGSSTTDIDITFIRVYADCKFTQLLLVFILYFTLLLLVSVNALRRKHIFPELFVKTSDRATFHILDEFSNQQPPIPHAIALLDAMAASPNFKSSTPSDNVAAFLNRIEGADPNSSEIEEDDSNESWGHWQFTAGGLTITKVIRDWACVGGVDMACKLLAATIQTCKVARYICLERNITPSSFLSDAYLNNMVERLYESWTAAGGVRRILILINFIPFSTDAHHRK